MTMRDLPYRHSLPRDLWSALKTAVPGWWNDNLPRMGASLAYYTLFSLAPVLIIVIAVAGMVFGQEAVRGEVMGQVQGLLGRDGAQTVQSMLESAGTSSPNPVVMLAGIITFIVGATGAFLELQGALNSIWRATAKSSGSLLRDLILPRLMSFGLVLGFAFILLTALVISAALEALSSYIGSQFPGASFFWHFLDLAISFGVITVLFALMFKLMPDAPVAWRAAWVGGLATAALFTAGKSLIGLYLGASSMTSTYGAAGSVMVILVWVYYSAQIVLFGAEFTRAFQECGAVPVPHIRPVVRAS